MSSVRDEIDPIPTTRPCGAATDAAIVAAMRRAVLLLVEHGDAEVVRVAAGYAQFLDAEDVTTLDAEVGLSSGWRQGERKRVRNELLIYIAGRHWPDANDRQCAKKLHAAARRYEAAGWIRDRRTKCRPDGLNGEIFHLLTLGELPAQGTIYNLFNKVRFTRKAISL